MIDLLAHLDAVNREVIREGDGDDEIVRLTMRRIYPTSAEDLWNALTDPIRLGRWFARLEGDFRVGGSFTVVEHGTPGTILECDAPRRLRMTYGGDTSHVTVTLTSAGPDETELRLEHTVPIAIAGSVAGALFVGPGWDDGVVALSLLLAADERQTGDPAIDATRPERVDYVRRTIDRWATVAVAAGATRDEIDGASEAALAHFAPA